VRRTYRARLIEACELHAEKSGQPILAHMPRMAEFYRKRANEQLRAARRSGDAIALADARAKLALLRWVDSWLYGTVHTWQPGEDVAYTMNRSLAMIGYSLRHLVGAYADHPQFRAEWIERQW
jgi:hypothetical protein